MEKGERPSMTPDELSQEAREVLAASNELFKLGLFVPLPGVIGMRPEDWLRCAKDAIRKEEEKRPRVELVR